MRSSLCKSRNGYLHLFVSLLQVWGLEGKCYSVGGHEFENHFSVICISPIYFIGYELLNPNITTLNF